MASFSALTSCVKYLMIFFNLLFVITGIIILAVGVAVQAEFLVYIDMLDVPFTTIPAFLIAIGVLIFLISFFGCCGAYKESYWMILTFSFLMVLIFILELAAGISGFVLRDQTANILKTNLLESMQHYNTTLSISKTWDEMQSHFSCCGVNSPDDWLNLYEDQLPMSCCPAAQGVIGTESCNSTTTHFEVGCVDSLSNYISGHAASIGAVGVCIGIVQFVGILFSCHLAKRTKYES